MTHSQRHSRQSVQRARCLTQLEGKADGTIRCMHGTVLVALSEKASRSIALSGSYLAGLAPFSVTSLVAATPVFTIEGV